MKFSKYIKPYLRYVILAPLLMVLEVAMDLAQPSLMASVVDNGILASDFKTILTTSALMLLCALLGVAGGMGCTYYSSKASQNFGADLRSDVFRKVQSFSFAETDRFSTGSLVTRVTNDVSQMQNLLMMALRMFIRAPLLCIGGIIMALLINVKFGLILLVTLPILFFFIFFVLKIATPYFGKMQKKLDKLNAVIQENLAGVRVVKAFVFEKQEKKRFDTANEDLTETSLKAMRIMAVISPVMMLLMNATVIAVIYLGGIEVEAANMEVGQIMAVVSYMTQALTSLMMMSMMFMSASRAKASAERLREVMQTEPSVLDGSNPGISVQNGEIVFENVSFQYPESSGEPVLQNICLSIQKGEFIAILGSTGSGKSSLVKLIPRFYDATHGSISVDGHDVREYPEETLRKGIGMVLQDAVLFSGTIMENIKWGNPAASDEEAILAAKTAQADDFICKLPDGYQTLLGQRGLTLSGGQKQRLSIARALLKKPKILIMDDSTSALDMGTEQRLQAAIKAGIKDMTAMIIAQRISSVMAADRIIVLENGRIAAEGSHTQLLENSDIYKDIYDSQLGLGGIEHAV